MPEEDWRARFARLLGAQAGGRIGPSYVARVVVAAIASLLIARAFDVTVPIWAVVSAIVVIMPELTTSMSAAGLRVVANLIGAGAGIAIAQLDLPSIAALVLGLVVVAGACRTARARRRGAHGRRRARDRAAARPPRRGRLVGDRVLLVMLGCGVALVVTAIAVGIARLASAWRTSRSSPRSA